MKKLVATLTLVLFLCLCVPTLAEDMPLPSPSPTPTLLPPIPAPTLSLNGYVYMENGVAYAKGDSLSISWTPESAVYSASLIDSEGATTALEINDSSRVDINVSDYDAGMYTLCVVAYNPWFPERTPGKSSLVICIPETEPAREEAAFGRPEADMPVIEWNTPTPEPTAVPPVQAQKIRTIASGGYDTVALKSDGSILSSDPYYDAFPANANIIALYQNGASVAGVTDDGRVFAPWFKGLDVWEDIVAVAGGDGFTIGLKREGTLVTSFEKSFENKYGEGDVGGWTDIVAIACGNYHTIGLRNDGTVVATGLNFNGQCDVGSWTEIVAIASNVSHTVGLKSDGTIVATGWNGKGQCDVDGWQDIVDVACGLSHTVGLKSDGTVVAVGRNNYGQCNVGDWTNIVAICCGDDHTVGLKSNGTLVTTGRNHDGQCNVGDWTDIRLY